MPAYSFCLLDPAGMTHDYFVRSFGSDDDARESAARLVSRSSGVEIWNGRRLIARLGAQAAGGDEMAAETWSQLPPPLVAAPLAEGAV